MSDEELSLLMEGRGLDQPLLKSSTPELLSYLVRFSELYNERALRPTVHDIALIRDGRLRLFDVCQLMGEVVATRSIPDRHISYERLACLLGSNHDALVTFVKDVRNKIPDGNKVLHDDAITGGHFFTRIVLWLCERMYYFRKVDSTRKTIFEVPIYELMCPALPLFETKASLAQKDEKEAKFDISLNGIKGGRNNNSVISTTFVQSLQGSQNPQAVTLFAKCRGSQEVYVSTETGSTLRVLNIEELYNDTRWSPTPPNMPIKSFDEVDHIQKTIGSKSNIDIRHQEKHVSIEKQSFSIAQKREHIFSYKNKWAIQGGAVGLELEGSVISRNESSLEISFSMVPEHSFGFYPFHEGSHIYYVSHTQLKPN